MEIISYISSSDWFTHYLFVPTMGIPFTLWLMLLITGSWLAILILKKMIW